MQKNVAGQKWTVFAFNVTTNLPVTGDAAQITGNLRLDGVQNAIDDTNPTETERGQYVFDITQAESNGDMITIAPSSTTPDVEVIGMPGSLWTTTPGYNRFLKYLQLMVRKDEAIETDNATELAELNADGGSGGGTFLNELAALQAIRDRGDHAWLTGGSAGATDVHTTEDWVRTVGDNDGGVGSDTLSVNGTYFATGETNAGTFLEVLGTFTLGANDVGRTLEIWGFYDGGGSHFINVEAWDNTTSEWEPIGEISMSDVVSKLPFNLSPNYTNAGTVLIRLIHGGGTGNPSHVLNIDKAQITASLPSTTADTLLAYMQLLMRSDAGIAADRSVQLGEINTDEGSGAGDYAPTTESSEAIRDVTATEAKQNTAQSDLDKLTGADGATLATSQPNYTPNVVVPDSAGTGPTLAQMTAEHDVLEGEHAVLSGEHADLPTAVENRQEMDSNSTELAAIVEDTGTTLPDEHAALPTATENRQEMDSNSTRLAAIETDTGEIGTAGAGLTDLGGMATGMKAEVKVEADQALTDYGANTVVPNAAGVSATQAKQNAAALINTEARLAKLEGLPESFAKDTAAAFPIFMRLASDSKSPAPGLTVTATRSRDGAAFGGITGSIAEISGGWYYVSFSQADLNGNQIAYLFDGGVTADVLPMVIRPVS